MILEARICAIDIRRKNGKKRMRTKTRTGKKRHSKKRVVE
jgi:hypothetical protein